MFVYICGAHCCGKTSILKALEQDKVINYRGHEIGKEFFYKKRFAPDMQGEQFEMEVAERELSRDIELANYNGTIGIETWHVGNLAYVAVRNPSSLTKFIQMANRSPFIHSAHGVWLRISSSEIYKRTKTFVNNPQWAAEFYTKIDSEIESCIDLLGLNEQITILNADKSLDLVYNEVKDTINNLNNIYKLP